MAEPDYAVPDYAVPDSSGPDYAGLIRPDRVHGSLYTDPRVFAGELARIWYRTWVYVGHESEVAEPGDYVRKTLGLQDVIMTRGTDGAVRLLLNRCAHRANLVCAAERGNARSFRCPYHGWTYRNTGELTAGWLKHRTRANWKLLAENETDGYHPQFVHGSIFSVTQSPIGALYSDKSIAVTRNLGHGHSENDLRPEFRRIGEPMRWFGTTPERVPGYVARMRVAYGEAAEQILVEGAPHGVVFPNLFVAEIQVFVIEPVSAGECVQHSTAVQLAGAPELNRRMISQSVGSAGPAGMLLADDTEMYERNQRGLAMLRPEWLDLRRGLHRERTDERGLKVGTATDETGMRGFWAHYLSLMAAA